MYTSKIVFNDDNGNRKQFYRCTHEFNRTGTVLGMYGQIFFDDDNGKRKQFHRCTHEFTRTRTVLGMYGVQYSARTRTVLVHIIVLNR